MLEAALHALDKVSTDLASEVTEAVQDALDEFAADMERERLDAARPPFSHPHTDFSAFATTSAS